MHPTTTPPTHTTPRRLSLGMSVSLLLAACSAPAAPPEAPKAETSADNGRRRAAPSIEGEVGGLDESKVKKAFAGSIPGLTACYAKGLERVPYMAGDVHFAVRITRDGDTRWAYVKDSNLGDRQTEACMLGVLKGLHWPRPEGGEGLADQVFPFTPGGDDRPPVNWSPEQLGAPLKNAKGTLAQCRKKAGTKGLKATMYVDTDGKPTAIGVSSADERGEQAVACVVEALSALKFPSPGSYASKVSLTID